MPKSKHRKNHKQKKAHWKLMMQHHRHGIAKLQKLAIENMIAAAQQEKKTVAEMLNDEEKAEKSGKAEIITDSEELKEKVEAKLEEIE